MSDIDQEHDKDLCFCGALREDHNLGDNHKFKLSMRYDKKTGSHVKEAILDE